MKLNIISITKMIVLFSLFTFLSCSDEIRDHEEE